MSDTESVYYAETEYQQTDYQGTDDEEEGPPGREEAGELPTTATQTSEVQNDVEGADKTDQASDGPGSGDAPGMGDPSEEDETINSKLPEEVLDILRDCWEGWKGAEGDSRKKQWRAIVQRLRALPAHKAMDKVGWQWRLKVCDFGFHSYTNI